MTESPLPLFEEVVQVGPPGDLPVLSDTAYVVGGSIAGRRAARVLSDRARRVVIEADEPMAQGGSRPGVPRDRQVHTLLPAGQLWLERWVPGITEEAQTRGASLIGPDKAVPAFNGLRQAPDRASHHLLATMSRSRRTPSEKNRLAPPTTLAQAVDRT